ncbi:alpha/beta hydrolase family esterase [Hyphomonas sp.]|uniref:extracellular catalytic domain type 1 short-chain-length polyhydroxyalkanoate depolymerase n=1 Tax=Hyphomonas sp. TaxID=87 RepID=UPI00391DEF8E
MNTPFSSMNAWARAWVPPVPARPKIMVETHAFGSNPGNLRMFSHVPAGLKMPAPLVVVLHGCTQTAEAHAEAAGWLALAARFGFAVLAPEQRPANNPSRCFNWFETGDAARGCGEAASIRTMIACMTAQHDIDAGRIFITGLSSGGAMTSAMLAAYPEVFAGGAIIAGLPHGAADSVQSALQAMRGRGPFDDPQYGAPPCEPSAGARAPRVTVWHGDADRTVHAVNAERIARQWTHAHALSFEAGERETLDRIERTVWRDPATGESVVETNIVRGLGHGTPLSTFDEAGAGSVAPFMIEAEISAVLEVARFWGLQRPPAPEAATARGGRASTAAPLDLGDTIMASLAGQVTKGAEAHIARALRQAGLMR